MHKLLIILICYLSLVSVNVLSAPGKKSEHNYPTINVLIEEKLKQKFLGFGASQTRDPDQRLFTVYPYELTKMLFDKVYGDLGMDWVKLWVASSPQYDINVMKDQFYKYYYDNGYLDLLESSGVKHLLLAPARGESAPTDTMDSYTSKLAQFIHDIYIERGIRVEATGIANEPAGFSPEQIRDAVKLLRSKLNALNMHHVSIIAAECASPDACAVNSTNAMKDMPEAWEGLHGVATHSYNMGANHLVEDLILDTDKEYWMTEAGRSLPSIGEEEPGKTDEASTVAARFLNDMNHSVTHWIWFIGVGHYDQHPNNDSGQVLVKPNDQTDGIKYQTKYHYLNQLRNTFDYGAQFYSAVSAKEGRMNWGHGQKPAITASMAKNPDGSWALGIVNTTGIANNKYAQFYSGSNYQVSITLPKEASHLKYQIFRSKPDGYIKGGILRTDRSGNLTLVIKPHELVTLRSIQQ